MTKLTPKKAAAITAALTAYLSAEAAARVTAPIKPPPPSPWGFSGRQEAMDLRRLMQRRAFR